MSNIIYEEQHDDLMKLLSISFIGFGIGGLIYTAISDVKSRGIISQILSGYETVKQEEVDKAKYEEKISVYNNKILYLNGTPIMKGGDAFDPFFNVSVKGAYYLRRESKMYQQYKIIKESGNTITMSIYNSFKENEVDLNLNPHFPAYLKSKIFGSEIELSGFNLDSTELGKNLKSIEHKFDPSSIEYPKKKNTFMVDKYLDWSYDKNYFYGKLYPPEKNLGDIHTSIHYVKPQPGLSLVGVANKGRISPVQLIINNKEYLLLGTNNETPAQMVKSAVLDTEEKTFWRLLLSAVSLFLGFLSQSCRNYFYRRNNRLAARSIENESIEKSVGIALMEICRGIFASYVLFNKVVEWTSIQYLKNRHGIKKIYSFNELLNFDLI